MSAQTIILPKDRAPQTSARAARVIDSLPADKAWRVEITEHKKRRSDEQNRYIWGVVYPSILKSGGETLAGWTAEDLHEWALGEWSGWEVLEGFGKKRLRPNRRSSKLTTADFAQFVAFIQQRMAEYGIYVPDPGEYA